MSIRITGCQWQLALLACLMLTGCAGQPEQAPNPNEIVIGVAGPMSGKFAAFGEQERWGVKTAVADINAAGGLLGKQLRVVQADDRCDPTRATSAANQLVDAHALLVVGHFCSSSSIKASSIYAADHIIQITPSSTNPILTEDGANQGWTTLFRVANTDDKEGVYAGQSLARQYPHGKIAVFSDGSSYGDRLTHGVTQQLQTAGLTPVLTREYQQDAQDFTDLVSALRQSAAEAVYIGGNESDIGLILRQSRAAGVTAAFFGGSVLNDTSFSAAAGSAADGVRFSDVRLSLDRAEAVKAVREMRGQNYEPEGYTLASYASMQAWAAGVTRAGTTDGTKVAAAMRSAPVDTVIGRLSWDAKGDIEQLLYAWYLWDHGSYSMATSN